MLFRYTGETLVESRESFHLLPYNDEQQKGIVLLEEDEVR